MLRYTGQPFVDVGGATITAWRQKHHPEELTVEDLAAVAQRLEDYYCDPQYKLVQNFVSVIFTNSHFVQPSKDEQDKRAYAKEVLWLFDGTPPLEPAISCTFFPERPAVMMATRQHIPLLNGATVSNFSPMGGRGIPVSGEALLAIHAMPLGCIKCGNLLALHQIPMFGDDDADMNRIFAAMALSSNLRDIQAIAQGSTEGITSFGSNPKTRYVQAFLSAQQKMREEEIDRAGNHHITGYYFTNYGPSPDLQILQLDSTVLRFIEKAQHKAGAAWQAVTYQHWVKPKKVDEDPNEENTRYWKNDFYEKLFSLPHQAHVFVKYLGRRWHLVELFLKEVLLMEQERIDTYRELGDRLGQYMVQYEAPAVGFYHRIASADKYPKLRNAIKSASMKVFKAGHDDPLISFDEFILAFEHPSEGYSQWRLGRDLIAMRMLEIMHANREVFDGSNLPDDVPEEDVDEE